MTDANPFSLLSKQVRRASNRMKKRLLSHLDHEKMRLSDHKNTYFLSVDPERFKQSITTKSQDNLPTTKRILSIFSDREQGHHDLMSLYKAGISISNGAPHLSLIQINQLHNERDGFYVGVYHPLLIMALALEENQNPLFSHIEQQLISFLTGSNRSQSVLHDLMKSGIIIY